MMMIILKMSRDRCEDSSALLHSNPLLSPDLERYLKNIRTTTTLYQTSDTGSEAQKTSTNHQLLRLTNRVINGFNSGDTTGGAFLDVEKTFDRVWHDGLLYKMIKLNFPSYIIHLVNSYLSDRTFQVKILATLSRIGTVSAGSPQGSILSPLLYNIYTHDFPTTPTVDVCLFADDAAIIAQACNPDMVRRYLQQYLKKLQSWLRKWRIKINVGKSQAIIFKKGQYRNRLRELKLFRNSIPWVRQVEYLGVTLDSKLTFNSHLRKITCKFKRTLYTLLPLLNRSSILSLKSKRLIYLQYLQPTLTCACQIWGCAAQHHLNKLQILQNRTLRLILNYPRFIARRYLHRDSNIDPINENQISLSRTFYDNVNMHNNPLIAIQSTSTTTGLYNHPSHSSSIPSIF
ncbi:RNA-directed DNA polymerase from mobile element jockey [Trichonephila clavipes]|nr:RNA-directed DNA polymerase from mobile element jockey [Trichonephila clavipes]